MNAKFLFSFMTNLGLNQSMWFRESKEGLVLFLYIQSNSSRSGWGDLWGGSKIVRRKVKIAAPPVDGDANDALLKFLKREFGIINAKLRLIRGETAKYKDVLISDWKIADMEAWLTKNQAQK